jgi:hypothetical protein
VLIESAPIARCGTKASELGAPLAEAGKAICGGCASRLLHDLNETQAVLAYLSDASDVPTKQSLKHATDALRFLTNTVPLTGGTGALLTEAERSVQRSDISRALELLLQWRANMRGAGLLPLA